MIIIPAIDIRGGQVVRLVKGDYGQETVYSKNPVIKAASFVAQGAKMIHIVDLDGAREGKAVNYEVIHQIAEECDVPIQVGGGIRNFDAIKTLNKAGVARFVIGTMAFDKEFLCECLARYGVESIVVGLDAKDGMVRTQGWLEDGGMKIAPMCECLRECGVKHIVFTDITRDGTLEGPNVKELFHILSYPEFRVVVSGGIGSLSDVKMVANMKEDNVFGIITGKAIYENVFTVQEAADVLKECGY